MADMLTTGVSSLRALQRALDTTSHNIANASTDGYNRQRVEFQTRPADTYGNNWIGTGVNVASVSRIYDQFLAQSARSSGSSVARLDSYASQAGRVDDLLGDPDNGLGTSLQNFTDSINEVSSTPNSTAARSALLAQAQALADRLGSYDQRLRSMSADVDAQLASQASDITQIAQNIAKLNGSIATAVQQTGQPPNDLLDQRDKLIDQLSKDVGVTTVADGDSINVFIGKGQPLVLGTAASTITTTQDPLEPDRLKFALQTKTGTIDLSSSVSGGTVGGLLDFRSQMLDPARSELGRITVAIANQVNSQHQEGMDLHGQMGGTFFNVGGVGVSYSTLNTGTATVSATRTDVGALSGDDYVLTRTATGYTLNNKSSGAPVSFTGTGTAIDPIVANGVSIVVGAGTATGDQYVIRPTRDAISGFSVAITDPSKVAAAGAIRTSAASANAGTGKISQGEVLDASNAQLLTTVNIVFTSATTYSVNGGADQPFTAGGNIDINGWRMQISGAPQTGDTFTVGSNAGATGDNRNAFALADSLKAGVLDGGSASVSAAVDKLINNVGLATQTAQTNLAAQTAINQSDISARDAVSGVNLDEEAANLLRYQQAYQASAQVISIANQMFSALMDAVRR
jgi:flagellar hook-associated protein 1 FlgK